MNNIQQTGFIRIKSIISDPKANPPIPAIIPISRSKFWDDIKAGTFPATAKLGKRCTAWRTEDMRSCIVRVGGKV